MQNQCTCDTEKNTCLHMHSTHMYLYIYTQGDIYIYIYTHGAGPQATGSPPPNGMVPIFLTEGMDFLAQYVFLWFPMVCYGFLCIFLDSYGVEVGWISYGFLRFPMDSYGFLRFPMDSFSLCSKII